MQTILKGKPKNKFGAIRSTYDGKVFDSKKEMRFYMDLKLKERATKPEDRVVKIECQVPYPMRLNGILLCKYFADFKVTYGDGKEVVYDVKSPITQKLAVYQLKKKLMMALWGISIKEV